MDVLEGKGRETDIYVIGRQMHYTNDINKNERGTQTNLEMSVTDEP